MSPHNDAPSPAGSFGADFHSPPVPVMSYSPSNSSWSSSNEMETAAADFHSVPRLLIPGVYVPTVCFFEDGTENLDTEAIARHAVRLARAGVTGLATQGSNGEAVHLMHDERQVVTATTRKALDEAGYAHMPIIVGCGAQSTRETISYCYEAWQAGGDFALVLPPAYYASLFAPAAETIVDFFTAVADASPIPVIIYNYPGAVNGLDLSSDVIIRLAAHPNIVGAKFTCGNTGKLNRVAAATRKLSAAAPYDPDHPEFLVLAGSADFAVQSLAAGGHGMLAGLANIAPRACLRTFELYHQGKHDEAAEVQEVVSRGDWTAIQGGVVAVKTGMQALLGYGGYARSPLPKPTAEQAKQWKEGFRELFMLEKTLWHV